MKKSSVFTKTIVLSVLCLSSLPLFAQEEELPVITGVMPSLTIESGTTATLWAMASGTRQILWVRATITPLEPTSNRQVTELFLGARGDDYFESTYDGFFEPGTFQIKFDARDVGGGRAESVTSTVTQAVQEVQEDIFEEDNSIETRTWFGLNEGLHAHTFQSAEDEDWVWFYAQNFQEKPHRNEVDVATRNLAPGVDTRIELYKFDPEDVTNTLTLIAENDDIQEGNASSFVEVFMHDYGAGFYAVRVINMGGAWGPGAAYDIRVWREQGALLAGAIAGSVRNDANDTPIIGAQVEIKNFGRLRADTNETGLYIFPGLAPDESYRLQASADAFESSISTVVFVDGGRLTRANFFLERFSREALAQALLDDFDSADADDNNVLSLSEAQSVLTSLTTEEFQDLDQNEDGVSIGELQGAVGGVEGEGEGEKPSGASCAAGWVSFSYARLIGDMCVVMLMGMSLFRYRLAYAVRK